MFTGLSRDCPGTVPSFFEIACEFCLCVSFFPQETQHINKFDPHPFQDTPEKFMFIVFFPRFHPDFNQISQIESNMHRFHCHHFASPFAPYSLVGKIVDSHRRSYRYSRNFHRKGGKMPIPLGEKGGRRRHKMVTMIWCMFDSP